jgi:hypothetical protein
MSKADAPKKPRGSTISFTTDEIEWLSWVMEDVLGHYAHSPVSSSASNKIATAANMLAALKQAENPYPERAEHPQH